MNVVEMTEREFTKRTRAIVQFGPATPTSGMRPAEYYAVVIDPDMVSPDGKYIRFDGRVGENEIHGWQRIEAMTVCTVLQEGVDYDPLPGCERMEGSKVVMRTVV